MHAVLRERYGNVAILAAHSGMHTVSKPVRTHGPGACNTSCTPAYPPALKIEASNAGADRQSVPPSHLVLLNVFAHHRKAPRAQQVLVHQLQQEDAILLGYSSADRATWWRGQQPRGKGV